MAINLKFDLTGNPEPPSIVLANRSGNKLGQLNVNVDSIEVSDKFNAASEFSFTLNKYIDGKLTPYWDKVVDFKLVYCPEWDMWFEIKVELDEATETVKTVFCAQLGQAELSQIMLYNIEINTDADIEREDYKTSILYDKDNPKYSILHRLLEKAPHYSIAYVDESIQRIQRQFSFDDTSICDAFNEIGEEIGCLFVYNSNSTKGGMPSRTISVYDLQQNCNRCGHRGEFTDKCPKCESTDITCGYGEDTTIFVTSDELATEGIQLVTDTDSVKNCFKLEGGDDLMTATIRHCNPNGSDYIWYFSDSIKEDMSKELTDGIESYDAKYQEYYKNHISELNEDLVSKYNELVEKYATYYNIQSTCLDCGKEGYFEEQCSNPNCNSKNILTGQKLQTIDTKIVGYPDLMTTYYNTIDLLVYLESGLMPNVEMNDTNAEEQVKLLTTSSLSPVAVNVEKIVNTSEATAKSAALSMAKVLVRPTYKVDVVDGSSSLDKTIYSGDDGEYRVWTGEFIVTNYSDEKDTATSGIISVRINNATETFIKQKLDKALNKENTDDYSMTGLFAKEYNEFCAELKKYALNPLDYFSRACETCRSILYEQGASDKDKNPDLYENLYKPYFDKQQAINNEMGIRQDEIAIIEGVWDKSDEDNPKCTIDGLQQYIEKCQKEIQEELNFENYLVKKGVEVGKDLWLEFCSYRREDKYSNSNYISDGLNNAELFEKANEFIGVAEEEIFKSAELQHSIEATLNNLLALPKFKPLIKYFKTGNWIRVRADDKVYKLRLLEYKFGYDDSESISVDFSNVTKIKNGTTDVQEVFSQATSMASSYDSVQRQAKKGNVARSTIDQWIVDGLNSANVQIKSNDSEEVLLTKSGLLARSYDDITGTYSPEQLKITHNIMAYTDDNWETVSSALGKHQYQKWKDNQWVTDIDYGFSSKFVNAGYVTGSQIIGGEIVSSNYKVEEEKGTYINLLSGDFEFAGGKIVYDSNKNEVTLSGVTIQWDSVNKPTIENIDGLSGITEDIRTIEQGLQATTINGQYVISPNIIGGYLNIKNSNNVGVVIDPNEDYIFQVYKDDATTIGVTSDGNAEFSGTITSSKIIGRSSLLIGDETKVGDYAEITADGVLTCTGADITGTIHATEGKIGGWDINQDGLSYSYNKDDAEFGVGLSPAQGGTYINSGKIEDNLGLVLYAGIKATNEIKAIAGTWRFNKEINIDEQFGAEVEFDFSGWFNHPTQGWTKYENEPAVLSFVSKYVAGSAYVQYAGYELDIILTMKNVMGATQTLYSSKLNDVSGLREIYDYIDETLLNREIGFGSIGIDDFTHAYLTSSTFLEAILKPNATFLSGSIGLYPAMIDKEGRLYAKEARIGGSIEVDSCTVGNIVMTNNQITLGAGAAKTNSVTIDKTDLWVGQNLHVSSKDSGGMAVSSINVGSPLNSANGMTEGTIEAKVINATTKVTCPTLSATNISTTTVATTNINATNAWSAQISSPRLLLTNGDVEGADGVLFQADDWVRWDMLIGITQPSATTGKYQGIGIDARGSNIQYDNNAVLGIGEIALTGSWKNAKFRVLADGTLERPYITNPRFDNVLYDQSDRGFLYIDTVSGDKAQVQMMGMWQHEGNITNVSDAHAKHDIESLDERYDVFFDNLSTQRFKYNTGTSDRYHIGYITQGVQKALVAAEIPEKEFAGVVTFNQGAENEKSALRYYEFVSLNTDQIQKLKKRVEELENRLKALE